jgi:hypothetical protein
MGLNHPDSVGHVVSGTGRGADRGSAELRRLLILASAVLHRTAKVDLSLYNTAEDVEMAVCRPARQVNGRFIDHLRGR